MIAACQLPNIVLEQMSSKQLLTTFLNYPLLFDLFAYNNPVDGFEKMTSRFNGFGALKERKDLAATVLNEYLKTEIGAVSSLKSDVERGLFTNTVSALELLIANNYVINQLTLSDSKILLTELLLKNKEKKAYKEIYGMSGKVTLTYVAAKILDKLDDPNWIKYLDADPKRKLFTNKMLLADEKILDEILVNVTQVLNK